MFGVSLQLLAMLPGQFVKRIDVDHLIGSSPWMALPSDSRSVRLAC
jgi:hypothetical protein